jgi:hypothetical protein
MGENAFTTAGPAFTARVFRIIDDPPLTIGSAMCASV